MANNKRKHEVNQMHQRKAKEQQYEAATKRLFLFPCIAVALGIFVLLLLFVTFADVYNSVVVEFSVSGWSFVVSGFTYMFTGEYIGTNPDTLHLYGALVEPFYEFATEWCEAVAILSVVIVIITVVNLAVQAITIWRKNHILNVISAVLSLVTFVLLIVCYAKCVDMNNATIISDYCRNPACVIRSYAIFPALFALGAAGVDAFAAAKYLKARKLLQ